MDAATGRQQQGRQALDERGLAGSVRSQQPKDLAGVDVQADVAQSLNRAFFALDDAGPLFRDVRLVQVTNPDDWLARRVPLVSAHHLSFALYDPSTCPGGTDGCRGGMTYGDEIGQQFSYGAENLKP
jgi:hypothetical protein